MDVISSYAYVARSYRASNPCSSESACSTERTRMSYASTERSSSAFSTRPMSKVSTGGQSASIDITRALNKHKRLYHRHYGRPPEPGQKFELPSTWSERCFVLLLLLVTVVYVVGILTAVALLFLHRILVKY